MNQDQKWADNLSVGVEELDRQHRNMLTLTHEMVRAAEEERGRDVVEALFSGLLAYTSEHFRTEEALLDQAGFPGLEEHRAQHRELIVKARNNYETHQEGGSDAAWFGMYFLSWVVLHIRNEDRAYTGHLHEAGIR